MPIYICICKDCETEKEVLQKVNDPLPDCEECGKQTEKGIAKSNFILKGACWYKDGYGLGAK